MSGRNSGHASDFIQRSSNTSTSTSSTNRKSTGTHEHANKHSSKTSGNPQPVPTKKPTPPILITNNATAIISSVKSTQPQTRTNADIDTDGQAKKKQRTASSPKTNTASFTTMPIINKNNEDEFMEEGELEKDDFASSTGQSKQDVRLHTQAINNKNNKNSNSVNNTISNKSNNSANNKSSNIVNNNQEEQTKVISVNNQFTSLPPTNAYNKVKNADKELIDKEQSTPEIAVESTEADPTGFILVGAKEARQYLANRVLSTGLVNSTPVLRFDTF